MGERIENFIAGVSPRWALGRKNAKSMLNGRYDAASRSTAIFQEFITSTTDADSSVDWDRKTLVERDRDLIRNVPVASAIIKRICNSSIGANGLTLHSQIDKDFLGYSDEKAADWQRQAEYIYRSFAESKESDIERQINFQERTSLTLQSELEGGDCFTLFINKKRAGSDFNLKLQTVEGEFVSTPNKLRSSDKIIEGIEKDNEGAPFLNHFSKYHPGDRINFKGQTWTARKVFDSRGRRNILHHYDKIRPGQTRGIPVLGPATGKLLQLGRLSDAELMASVINAYYALIVQGPVNDTGNNKQSPNEENSTLTEDDNLTLGNGIIARVAPGSKVEGFDSARPNLDFWIFFKSIVIEIGAMVGVPMSSILIQYDKSYSASRGEQLIAWDYFLSKRTHMALNLCQPTYAAVMDEAVFKGMISAPGYFNSMAVRTAFLGSAYQQWTGPIRPAIDELKEAKALDVYHNMKAQSLKEIIAKTTGKDNLRVHEQLVREHELRVKSGLENPIEELTGAA